jgi:hypothetical protein
MATQGALGRVTWYANRLSAMSGPEIVHRVGESWKKRAASRWSPGWASHAQPDGPLPVLPAECDVSHADEDVLARWRDVADRAMARRFSCLGVEWPGDRFDWHLDPVSGRLWPSDRYCFAIEYRHTADYGDVKYVWEVNRLQHIQTVAALAKATANQELADFAAAEIMDWIEANPPYLGINWTSGIELALRAVSVLTATRMLGPDAFSDRARSAIRAFLAASAEWLQRYPSGFSSANNHLVAEAVGLFVIGAAYADHPRSAQWQARGRAVLEREIGKQIFADGVGAEQSPTYTSFTLELYLVAVRAAEALGKPFSPAVYDRLAKAGEALRHFIDENGHALRIGDDDEGRVVGEDPESELFYAASVLASVAAICDREDIAPPVAPANLRGLLLGRLVAENAPRGVRTLNDGGYTVLRDTVHGKELILAMDHGPLGYLSIAAHGHADALALWMRYGGKPLLADAGTYLYHSGGAWRDAFRGTALHNTMTVEGVDSSRIAGAFNWKTKAVSTLDAVETAVDRFACKASHDGYLERFAVRHHRALKRVSPDRFVVEDRLEGENPKALDVAIGFLAGEGVSIRQAGEGVFEFVSGDTALMRLSGTGGLAPRLVRGDEDEKLGWLSPRFGVKLPAWQLRFEGKLTPGRVHSTELVLL